MKELVECIWLLPLISYVVYAIGGKVLVPELRLVGASKVGNPEQTLQITDLVWWGLSL